eukprot:CAMPEP_0182559176 /NCGR_PEP_ID=MMETSP1324-20130603/2399_1 /TAXON_ID=236786 /ORGANISM="Florenciella sp., Strain RCC1587" /LENGTH=758 /DNA_ID=CAMNT_0024771409 /DNA_START=74 /DNA_END=2350 /DNA_ORIENTATION=+
MLLVAALSAMAFFQEGAARVTTSSLNTIETTTPEQAARMAFSASTAAEVAPAEEVATVGGQKLEAFYWEVDGGDEETEVETETAQASPVVVSDVEEGAPSAGKVAAEGPMAKKVKLDHDHKREELEEQKANAKAASDVTPPHIVYFLIDDQGYGDIGQDSDLAFASPTFSKLANDGIALTNFYALHLCTPARAALLTGLYPVHTGMQHSLIAGASPWGLPDKYTLLPELLADESNGGYRTHMIGKWHLGHYAKAKTPLERGFHSFYGFFTGFESAFAHVSESTSCDALDGCYYDLRNQWTPVQEEGSELPFLMGSYAESLVRSHVAEGTTDPFFLYFALPTVHAPVYAPPKYLESSGEVVPSEYMGHLHQVTNIERRKLAAMTLVGDEIVANVTELMKEVGMADNCVTIISSDNGSPRSNGGTNFPLRGMKGFYFEGGLKVKAVVHSHLFPQHLRGTTYNGLFHLTDWVPTLVEGAANNKGALSEMNLDGVNQWSALMGKAEAPRTSVLHNIDLMYDENRTKSYKEGAYMKGDMKVVFGQRYMPMWPVDITDAGAPAKRFSKWGAGEYKDYLFNISADPGEAHDLREVMPEVYAELMLEVEAFIPGMVESAYCDSYDNSAYQSIMDVTQFVGPWMADSSYTCDNQMTTDGGHTTMSRKRDYCVFELLPAEECTEYASSSSALDKVGMGGEAAIETVPVVNMDLPEPIEEVDRSNSAESKSSEHTTADKTKAKGTGTKIADSYGGSDGSMLEDFGFFGR